jgi:hypothetical protein
MDKGLAESFVAGIEQDEVRQCRERLNRYWILAATTYGEERQQWLRELEAAKKELAQWTALVSVVKSSAGEISPT